MSLSVPASPASIKKLEKQLNKEAKREDSEVKHALKEVQSSEKSKAKAQKVLAPLNLSVSRIAQFPSKAAMKAEQMIEKLAKIETATLKALNKATHQHEVVVVDLRSAEKDAEVCGLI
jgi:CII-binding regulator of phage lambda lysogenization HflD